MRKERMNAHLQHVFMQTHRHTDTQNSYLHEKYITSCISPSMHDKCLLLNVPAATWPDRKLPATLQQNKRSVIHSSPDSDMFGYWFTCNSCNSSSNRLLPNVWGGPAVHWSLDCVWGQCEISPLDAVPSSWCHFYRPREQWELILKLIVLWKP